MILILTYCLLLKNAGLLSVVFAHGLQSTESLEGGLAGGTTCTSTITLINAISGLLAEACVLCLLEVALASLAAWSITGGHAPVMAVALMVLRLTHED